MSTFMLDDEHVHALVHAAFRFADGPYVGFWCNDQWLRFTRAEATELGTELKATNAASLEHGRSKRVVVAYGYRSPRQMREPVEILKAIDCYEYQACEAPNWDASVAKAFCQWLRKQAIYFLPGYEKAEWGIDDPEPTAPTVISY